jgi:hypothetical protein
MVKDILKSLDYLIISITSEAISNGGDANPRPKLSDGSPSLKFTSTQKASSPTANAKMVKPSPIGSTPLCDPIPSRCTSSAPSTVQQPSTATDHPLGRSVHTRPPPVAPVAPPPPLIGEERDEPVLWVLATERWPPSWGRRRSCAQDLRERFTCCIFGSQWRGTPFFGSDLGHQLEMILLLHSITTGLF